MKVFYRPEMSLAVDSYSPSAKKPELVAEAMWGKYGDKISLEMFDPIKKEDLYRVHSQRYVDSVFNLTEDNGFGTREKRVNEALLYTNGSIVAAALEAYRNGGITCSPTSGFHHAGWNYGGGFCTFNGLTLAADEVIKQGARRVGIIDCDCHYGDGTVDILHGNDRLKLKVEHFTAGDGFGSQHQVPDFVAVLRYLSEQMAKDCDLIIYQAGADAHIMDPLGGWMTTEQMAERDQLVFETAGFYGTPIVWNLAGGYQKPVKKVVDIHLQTADIALAELEQQKRAA